MGFDNILLNVDETLSKVLGEWDIYTTSIAAAMLAFLGFHLFARRDADSHPMLLARQAQGSAVRQPGESAVYRSHASPHGMDLNGGLNVKDAGVSKWARGRNGDLRDVWRRVANGPLDSDGKPTNEKGRIMTILGTEQVIEHNLDEISRNINIIGQYIQEQNGTRVGIYLPNSIELLITLFACSFYGLTPVLLPYDQPIETIVSMLKASKVDSIVAAVGSLSFDPITKEYPALKHLIWVVDDGSKHMDWNEIPKGTGGAVNVSTWQEIIEDHKSVSSELPTVDSKFKPTNLVAFWQLKSGDFGQMIEYSQANLVSAISAQLSAIPTSQRISQSDLFFAADSLSNVYVLVVTLAAIYYNSSLALNSVAGQDTDLVLATQGISPTILVASSSTLSRTHKETSTKLSSVLHQIVHWWQTRTLTQDGVMPLASVLTRFNDSIRPAIGTTPGKLRLVFVSEQAGSDYPPVSSGSLSDLRIFTGARVIYALTAAKVAGAVAQTTFYDYRVIDDSSKHSHFGAPVSSVEVILKDTGKHINTDDVAIGEVFARGPAVVDGEAALGIIGTIREDHTLAPPEISIREEMPLDP